MKKYLLLTCIFSAGLTLTTYAMESTGDGTNPPSGSDVTVASVDSSALSESAPSAQPDANALLAATNAIYRITGEYVSLGDLAQQKPGEINKTAQKFLILIDLILTCNRKHPASFTSVSDHITTLQKAHCTLATFIGQSAWHLPRLPFRRAAPQAPAITLEQAHNSILTVALAAPRLTSIVLPLLRCRCTVCCGTTAALVLLAAISIELLRLGYVPYFR